MLEVGWLGMKEFTTAITLFSTDEILSFYLWKKCKRFLEKWGEQLNPDSFLHVLRAISRNAASKLDKAKLLQS